MAKQYESLTNNLIDFINKQKIFFVGTATEDSRVNISPKGMDSFRVLDDNQVIWLNVTGSGNETAAHVQISPRMTIMFCAFEGPPLILRLYGSAKVIHHGEDEWQQLYSRFTPIAGARQIFVLSIELVQTSCGMAVPLYDYGADRTLLSDWAKNKGDEGIKLYWEEKNQKSIDDIPSNIMEKISG